MLYDSLVKEIARVLQHVLIFPKFESYINSADFATLVTLCIILKIIITDNIIDNRSSKVP
jgi:hypothetical protein